MKQSRIALVAFWTMASAAAGQPCSYVDKLHMELQPGSQISVYGWTSGNFGGPASGSFDLVYSHSVGNTHYYDAVNIDIIVGSNPPTFIKGQGSWSWKLFGSFHIMHLVLPVTGIGPNNNGTTFGSPFHAMEFVNWSYSGPCCHYYHYLKLAPGGDGWCQADYNKDGQLSIDDFIDFQTDFSMGYICANCDDSSQLTIDDFICFQTVYAIGC